MTKIVLQTLRFSNMFSYGESNELPLDSNRITQLSGSNGNGKTSLALIIQELLFNKNNKNVKKGDIANRNLKTKTWQGELIFTVDGVDYAVQVSRAGAATKVKLLQNNIDISEHKVLDTYKKIQDILSLDFTVFSQLTYQSSVDLLDFLKATDTNRKKFLINLFNLERYLELGDKIKLINGQVEKELVGLQGELRSVESFLNSTDIPELKAEAEVPSIDDSLYAQAAQLKAEIENLNDTCKRIDRNNLYIKEQQQLKFDAGLKQPEPFEHNEKLENLKTQTSILQAEIASITKQKANIKINTDCPACGQPIDNSHIIKIKQELQEKLDATQLTYNSTKAEFIDLQTQFDSYSKELEHYKQNQQAINRFEQLIQLINTQLPTKYPNMSELVDKQQQIDKQITQQEQIRNKAITHNKQVSAHNAKVQTLIEQKNEFLIRQKTLNTDIIRKSSRLNSLAVLKKAFSTSGIVAFKLENLTKELETTINYYLSLLSDGQFQVEFKLDKEKLNIDVINNGASTPIETVSGGEFSRIQTSILLAIRNLLSKLGGSSINLLFLDEIMAVLDEAGKESLIDVLQQETNLNVFLISHEFQHPLISKINIIKENNTSYIQR
jgi:DNA repair exonuclease SbcCD ATPase subunit